jgi:hypothetical protein
VRVRAADEMEARKVVPAVLVLPGPDEVRMANDGNAKFGWDATITSVNFRVKGDLKLVGINGKKVKRTRELRRNRRGISLAPWIREGVAAMQDYEFEVTIVVIVRVKAETEDRAREVVASSALGSPSADEIRMANEREFLLSKQVTIVAVDFSKPDEDSVRLIAVERPQ